MTSASRFGERERAALEEVLRSQALWRGNGPGWGGHQGSAGSAVDRLEDSVRVWQGRAYALAVNSGTSANEAAVASLGLDPGDEVICPAASPVFVPFAVLAAGCIPVFADVDPATMLIDPAQLERVCGPRTRAVVAVHLWGLPAPMTDLMREADRLGLAVLEDCAQAVASYHAGGRVGGFGVAASFSLQQSKLISSGEGGLMVTGSAEGYARAALYSNSGIPSLRYGVAAEDVGLPPDGLGVFGHNHRMGELQAAVAQAQLDRLEELLARRAVLVTAVQEELDVSAPECRLIGPATGDRVSYWRCPLEVPTGRGTYVGIPQIEPVFAAMERSRRTPWGLPLPDHVRYVAERCPGALEGAARTVVVPLDAEWDEEAARSAVRKALGRS